MDVSVLPPAQQPRSQVCAPQHRRNSLGQLFLIRARSFRYCTHHTGPPLDPEASFRGAGNAREPGIHTHGPWLWIPALAAVAAPPELRTARLRISQHLFVPAARSLRPRVAAFASLPRLMG